MKIKVQAYAKINLLLDILSALPNGYHDLYMIMQSVDIFDTVTAELTGGKIIEISCDNPDIPVGQSNIAYKAAEEFFKFTHIKNPGVKIHIEKRIPHAAGLAGGSADAAGTIIALNALLDLNLSDRQLIKIGKEVGADVPFCLLGGTMLAQYTGTVLSYLPDVEFENMIISKPKQDVSTKEAYSAFDNAQKVRHLDKSGMLQAVIDGNNDKICKTADNVFEQFIDVPDRVLIKSVMRDNNAKCACMSGSGPSVFGIFENNSDAKKAYNELKKDFKETYLCRTVDCGCKII